MFIRRNLPGGDMKATLAAVTLCLLATPAMALDHVAFRHGESQRNVSGKVLVTGDSGGVLLLARDGTLYTIEKKDLVSRTKDDAEFKPLSPEETAAAVLAELPEGFEAHVTAHYVICHNTTKGYATWCGALFERLHRGFINFWSRRGLKLHEPEFPLVAVIFATREGYQEYAKKELGEAAAATIGLYSLHTNRMTMYDLTSLGTVRRPGDRRLTSAQINAMLSRPEGERTVATIVHEATHQMAFNCGMHLRYADIPVWVSEGIAMYFETPDLKSRTGWSTIGAMNRQKLAVFKRNLPGRGGDALQSLIANDDRFRDTRTAGAAYGEAWAMVYFLMKGSRTSGQFVDYLKMLAEKPQLAWDKPADRLEQFQDAFGKLDDVDAAFRQLAPRWR